MLGIGILHADLIKQVSLNTLQIYALRAAAAAGGSATGLWHDQAAIAAVRPGGSTRGGGRGGRQRLLQHVCVYINCLSLGLAK